MFFGRYFGGVLMYNGYNKTPSAGGGRHKAGRRPDWYGGQALPDRPLIHQKLANIRNG
jgi:hypothetical protein